MTSNFAASPTGAEVDSQGSASSSAESARGPKLLSLEEWVKRCYDESSAPCLNTVRRWVREQRIHPAPKKQGRGYFFDPEARYS